MNVHLVLSCESQSTIALYFDTNFLDMKSTLLRFGSYAFLTAMLLFFFALYFLGNLDYSTQEILGYLSMVISLLFIYPSIKYFRDSENNGSVSFGKAFLLGLIIAVLAGIGFAIIDYLFTAFINPDFLQEYMTHQFTEMQKSLSPEEFEIQKEILQQQMEAYGSSGFMAFLMFATVVLIGIPISLISALLLHRKK